MPKIDPKLPFSHPCAGGCRFEAENLFLEGEVTLRLPSYRPKKLSALLALVARDTAEAVAFHAIHIHPELPRFPGYDSLNIRVLDDE